MPPDRPFLRHAPAFSAQVVAFFALWLLLTGTPSVHELVLGAAVAVVASVGSTLAWPRRFRAADARALAQAWRLPKYVLTGTGEILLVLARHLLRRAPADSLLLAVPFDPGEGERGEARAALAVAYTSMTPNFLVLGVDRERHLLVFHQVKRSAVPEMTRRLGAKG